MIERAKSPERPELAKYIDHTILKPEATEKDVKRLCAEAREYGFASVCVNPCYAKLVSKELAGSEVKTCCVIGFPLGASSTRVKALEAKDAIKNGAAEIDMVINIGAARAGRWAAVRRDIASVVRAAKGRAAVKVIIETCLLNDREKVKACLAAKEAGADFVKTSTGFSSGGATAADVRLMRETVGEELGVKASGGIRSAEKAKEMLEAGASRLGTSSGLEIIGA
ncbi:MAG: deoxyribose-phosphate aldolase [Oscillospiraceae bacterium]|nr:deoxyribose-phosphate aldolase [Oscillospiraceae bacterium]